MPAFVFIRFARRPELIIQDCAFQMPGKRIFVNNSMVGCNPYRKFIRSRGEISSGFLISSK